MPETKLKKGWTHVAFGDVVQLSRERTNEPEELGFDRYVGLEHIEPGDLKIRRWGNIADGTTFTSVFRAGQVLFGKRRAYQRKLALADFDGICSGDIYVFTPKNERLIPELLPFICQTDSLFQYAVGTSAGSLSPRTNWNSLAQYEFALPPLDEQRRIAEVLNAINMLAFKSEALLRSAECVRDSFAFSVFDDTSKKHTKENTWVRNNQVWKNIELMALVTNKGLVRGPFGGSIKKEIFVEKGFMVYEQQHAINGNLTEGRYFINEHKYNEMKRFQVESGDVIMSCSGTFGKVMLINEDCPRGIINQALLKMRPNQNLIYPEYLLAFLRSNLFASSLGRLSMGSAIANVASIRLIERISVPLPSLPVQSEIIEDIEHHERAIICITDRLDNSKRILRDASNNLLRLPI